MVQGFGAGALFASVQGGVGAGEVQGQGQGQVQWFLHGSWTLQGGFRCREGGMSGGMFGVLRRCHG